MNREKTKTSTFEIEGHLLLAWQEGDFAQDAFFLGPMRPDYNVPLDDAIAEFFDVERDHGTGNRRVGRVRITVERLED